MEIIKKLFKRMIITTIIFAILGLLTWDIYIFIGLVSGSLISIQGLYMLSNNVKSVAYSNDTKIAKKIAVLGYIKRMVLYIIYLVVIFYFFNFRCFISSIIGLSSIKFNIYILVFTEKLEKLKK